jgi:hypothetical protein
MNGPASEPGIAALTFDGADKLFGATTPSTMAAVGSTFIAIDSATAAITSTKPTIDRLDALVFIPPRSAVLKKKLKDAGEKVRLFGQINDAGDPACRVGQKVSRSFKYRAFLPESNVCDDATSKAKKVKA